MKKILTFLLAFAATFSLRAQNVLFLTGGPVGPGVSVIGSYSSFSTTVGTASSFQTVTFVGTNLTANVVVGPATGMEFSTTGVSFTSTVTYTQTGGSASGTLYTRISSSTAQGIYNGNIPFVSNSVTLATTSYSATVSASGTNRVVQVNLWDGSTTGGRMNRIAWNDWSLPSTLSFGQTVTSSAFNDSTGAATTITATFSIGQADNTANGFFTDNGSGYASATTSGFPDTVFRLSWLFTGGATSSSDTLRFNALPSSSSNFTIELVSSRATSAGRTETFTVGSITLPSTGSFTADNNLNNVSGGHVPLYWTNVSKDGNNQITCVIHYTNQFGYFNGFRITWTP